MSELKNNLIQLLDDLIVNTDVSSSCLITEDGLVIASNSQQNEEQREVRTNFAAISASILSMADRGIEIVNANQMLDQIKIDASLDKNLDEDFTILISRAFSNILLQVIFPKRINIGLIQFETSRVIKEINKQIKQHNSEELFDELGSLL